MTKTLTAAAAVSALGVVAFPILTTTAASAASATPECKSGDVTTSYRYHDAGAGHSNGFILVKNVSGHSCRTGGFGGLSYVGHGNGTQVGAAATREGSKGKVLTLRPGKVAVSEIQEVDTGVYPSSECRPTSVDGFRVYIPNETHSQYVVHKTTVCGNSEVQGLQHRPFRHQYV